MLKGEREHIIRAAAAITNQYEIVVVDASIARSRVSSMPVDEAAKARVYDLITRLSKVV